MAIASVVFDPTDGSEALSVATVADSKAVSAGALASTADSKAETYDSAAISTADSKAVSAGTAASTADSKAVVSDSKAVSAGTAASTADSKADSVATVAGSAIGSEPANGEFRVTDINRNSDGSIVVKYDDSAIGS